jgi:ribulose-bisphosphate carboxylase large chain
MTRSRLQVIFHVRSEAALIEARARAIAIEQSVEVPLDAIDDVATLADVVGTVDGIVDLGAGVFEVRIALAAATVGNDAGQLLNMAFGNTSLHDDVVWRDIVLPPELEATFGGPRHGLAGLRARFGGPPRALTCSALKPQGLDSGRLADLAERFARGRLDFIKDDHGLADQDFSPFAERVPAIAASVRRAAEATGHPTRYLPSLSGNLEQMHRQVRLARDEDLDTVLIAPMVAGVATVQALVRAWPEVAFFAHPTLGGAARIAPDLLIGKLFRLFGVDAPIFPNFGGRFGYSQDTCRRLAHNATVPNPRLNASVPVPAGGMTLERVPEILDFYGTDVVLLLGGNLLQARERLTEATLAFTEAVARHGRGGA